MSVPFNPKKPKNDSTTSSSSLARGLERKGGAAEVESDDDLPVSPFEKMMRERGRQQERDPAMRKEERTAIKEGWVVKEHGVIESPKYHVRSPSHEFSQDIYQQKGVCEVVGQAFICLRLAGYSIEQTLKILRSHHVKSRMQAWHSAQRNQFLTWNPHSVSDTSAGTSTLSVRLTDIAEDIRDIVDKLNRSEHSPPVEKNRLRFQALQLFNPKVKSDPIFFQQLVGCYPPRNVDRSKSSGINVPIRRGGCHVNDIAIAPSPWYRHPDFTAQRRNTIGSIQSYLFKKYQPTNVRSVHHPESAYPDFKGQSWLLRTALPFTFIVTWSKLVGAPGHGLVMDLSDPDEPGIFDPNFGWMALHQGTCSLSLEKLLVCLYEFYTGNANRAALFTYEMRQDLKTGQRELVKVACVNKGERYIPHEFDASCFEAHQIFVQSLPSPAQAQFPKPSAHSEFERASLKRRLGE